MVGYWFQEDQKHADLDAQKINSTLKHLGHGVPNITSCFNSLIEHDPRWALQTKKSGSSKQARKKYRITGEGIKKVRSMLRVTQQGGED